MTSDRPLLPLTAWAAAGVCHEVLLRTLPSLRHDMAGILSVARMDLALLKRWLARLPDAGMAELPATGERLQRVDQQFATLLKALHALQGWGDEPVGGAPAAEDLLAACLGWVRPVLSLAKVTLECRLPAAEGGLPCAPVSPSAFRYLCLGALWYWVDQCPALNSITVALCAPGALEVEAGLHPEGRQETASGVLPPVLGRIDAAALQAVACREGWRLQVSASRLSLHWADGEAGSGATLGRARP